MSGLELFLVIAAFVEAAFIGLLLLNARQDEYRAERIWGFLDRHQQWLQILERERGKPFAEWPPKGDDT